MDLNAVIKFIEDKKHQYNDIEIPIYTLQEALELCKQNKKPLLLYLHVEDDMFSLKFGQYLDKLLLEDFNLLAWDVSEPRWQTVLLATCNNVLNFSEILCNIREGRAGLFVVYVEGSELELRAMFTGDLEEQEFIGDLYERTFNISKEICTSTKTSDALKTVPLTYNFMEEIISHGIALENSLDDAILLSKKYEKPLLIYMHNNEDVFSKLLRKVLNNDNVNTLFKYFTFYAWDVYDEITNERLKLLASEHDLRLLKDKVDNKSSGLCFFVTLEERITLHTVFEGKFDCDNFIFHLYNLYRLHEEEKNEKREIIQKECVISAINDFEEEFGMDHLPFLVNTLDKAVEMTLQVEPIYMQKILVLWYFNNDNIWCKKLGGLLVAGDVRNSLENLFHILPWDVKNESYHKILKNFVRDQFDLEFMCNLIDRKENALFFFVSCNKNQPNLFHFTYGDFNVDDLVLAISEIQSSFERTHNITDLAELNAIKLFSINNYEPSLQLLYINAKPLCFTIPECCLCQPAQNRKMLILVFSNNEDVLIKNFFDVVKKNLALVNDNFTIVPWDITETLEYDKLQLAIRRYFDLENMESLLKLKRSGIYIFMPIAHTLALFHFMEPQMSTSRILYKLQESISFFTKEREIEMRLSNADITGDGAVQFQQAVCDQLGNRDYDCFKLNEKEDQYLKQKIYFALYGSPNETDDVKTSEKRNGKVDALFSKIVDHSKKFSSNPTEVVLTCIYNCLIPLPKEKLRKFNNDPSYNSSIDFTPVPIFVLRKCVECPTQRPCRIFIDQDERVYSSWHEYLNKSKLPKCLFVVPKEGRYQSDMWGNIRLECRLSPKCGIGANILGAIDIGTSVVGAGAGLVGVAALIPAIPVAPVFAIGATIAGVGVGVYSMVRSTMTIHDRICHDQSMSILNIEARGAYFNIVASTLGFTGSGATAALTYFAQNGRNIGLIARGAVNGLTGANVLISGAAVANSTFEVIRRWVDAENAPDSLTILQLSSSILFFGHAVYNMKSANTIITEAQLLALKEIKASLRSNRERKIFDKLTKETIQVTGGQADVINYIKKLNNIDEILAILNCSNNVLNENGIRYYVRNGQLIFNGLAMDLSEFTNMSKMQQSEYLLNLPPMIETTPIQTRTVQNMINAQFIGVAPRLINTMFELFSRDTAAKEMCSRLVGMFSNFVQEKLFLLTRNFLEEIEVDLQSSFLKLYPQAQVPVKVLEMIIEFFKTTILQQERDFVGNHTDNQKRFFNRKNVNIVVQFLERAIITSTMSVNTVIKDIIKYSIMWIGNQIFDMCRETQHVHAAIVKNRTPCVNCEGFYYV